MTYLGRHYETTDLGVSAVVHRVIREGFSAYQVDTGKVGSSSAVIEFNGKVWASVLGSDKANLVCFHRETLILERRYVHSLLQWADDTNFSAVVIRTGAAPERKIDVRRRMVASIRSILAGSSSAVPLLIENGLHSWNSLSSLHELCDDAGDERLGIALNLGIAHQVGYEPDDLMRLNNTSNIQMVQMMLPATRPGSASSIRSCAWGESEIQALLGAWSHLPTILRSSSPTDYPMLQKLAVAAGNNGPSGSVYVDVAPL